MGRSKKGKHAGQKALNSRIKHWLPGGGGGGGGVPHRQYKKGGKGDLVPGLEWPSLRKSTKYGTFGGWDPDRKE